MTTDSRLASGQLAWSPGRTEPVILRDGSLVVFRPITIDDAELETNFIEGLSPTSRYQRFFYGLQRLTPAQLDQLLTIDYVNTFALIATTIDPTSAEEVEIGVARYAATEQPGECEFAVVVADQWQGKGLATALMQTLITQAYCSGFQRIVGDILAENSAMQALARQLGFSIRFKSTGVVEVTLGLER